MKRSILIAALIAAAFGVPAQAATDREPFPVSLQSASDGGAEVNKDAGASDVSANGRYIVFESKADNLSPMARNVRNIYRYDTKLEKIELVSRNGAAAADEKSQDPAISGDGRYVAFRSNAENLGPTDRDVHLNIFVYDAKTNRTQLVSRQSASDGGRPANDWSEDPDISADGNIVSFTTTASNLGGSIDARKNVYIYNRVKKDAQLVSRQASRDGGQGGNRSSLAHSRLSDDGRFVAFTSKASNLGGRARGLFNGYVFDRRRDRLLPVTADASRRNSYASVESISGNGRRVAYYVNSGKEGTGEFVEDVGGGHRKRIGKGLIDADLDHAGGYATATDSFHRKVNGRRIAATRVVRVNLISGRTRVVSEPILRPDGDDRPSDSFQPAISGDGRAVSFTSGISGAFEHRGAPDLIFLRRYR